MKFDLKKLPGSEVELIVELDPKEWGGFIDEAVHELAHEVKVEGFRPGHAPRNILEARIGLGKILEKAADLAVKKTYVNLIAENKIEAIGRPEIQVTKLATDNPFEFKAKVAVMPQIEIGDWRVVVKKNQDTKKSEIKVETKEIQDALKWVQKSRTPFVTVLRPAQKGDRVEVDFTASKSGQTIDGGISKNHPLILGESRFVPGFEENISGLKEKDEKKFSLVFPVDFSNQELAGQVIDFEVKVNLVQEPQIPELTDEFAKSLGSFTSLAALEKSVEEGLVQEKKERAKELWRAKVLEEIVKQSEIDTPHILIDSEIEKMLQELSASVGQMGLDFATYLKNIKKTEDQLRQDWHGKALERVKAALVLSVIAKQEEIKVLSAEVEEAISKALASYPDLETVKKQIDMERFREYTIDRLTNEKVFQLLENLQ